MECRNLSRFLSIVFAFIMILTTSAVEARVRFCKPELKYEFQLSDCFKELVIAINGTKTPGPSITAQLGDVLIFELKNSFLTENISIHWHGIQQIGNGKTWIDGRGGVSQCPQGKTFFYRFVVDKPQSYLYYAHYSMRYGSTRLSISEQALVQDDYEMSIILDDWCTTDLASKKSGPFVWVGEPKSLLYHGRARFNCSPTTDDISDICNRTKPEIYSPYLITIIQGKTIRLRISSLTSLSVLNFEIQGHNTTVVEADGHFVEPLTVRNLNIYPDETYSVLVKADQDPSKNYWAASNVIGRELATSTVLAILNYYSNPNHQSPPTTPPADRLWNNFLESSHFGRNSLFLLFTLFYRQVYMQLSIIYRQVDIHFRIIFRN
ncbi:hypothetical protein MKW98_023099 [Papaver atlanticum]|uniref:L-ascorbate oxidase n=1 Tax=Papaver atlanticum TaxID=357466 RepID=A0AAD4T7U2_9MAGN|nr:hypothetical protein MKW98_023099 [Papaver atlanticum]